MSKLALPRQQEGWVTPVLFMHDLQNQNELVQRSIASERCLFLPGLPSYVSHGGIRYSRSAKLPQQTFSCKLSPLIPSFFPVCIQNFSVCAHSYFCSAFYWPFICTRSSLWVRQVMPPGLGSAGVSLSSPVMVKCQVCLCLFRNTSWRGCGHLGDKAPHEFWLGKASGHLCKRSTCPTVQGPEFIYVSGPEGI